MKLPEGNGYLDAASMALHMDGPGLEIQGRRLKPDQTKGYLEFFLAHPYPVVTSRSNTLHAGTVARSFQSMLHQGVNFEHRVRQYFKEGNPDTSMQDRYIGTILDVEFPQAPQGGWVLSRSGYGATPTLMDLAKDGKLPSIRCVAAIHKQAQGVDKFLGEHQSGKHQWTVSLEVSYGIRDSGVLIEPGPEGVSPLWAAMAGASRTGDGASRTGDSEKEKAKKQSKLPKKLAEHCLQFTPEDFQASGLLYVPVMDAPDEMEACFNAEKREFTELFYGHKLVLVMGGLNSQVHFMGTGVVRFGAEPTAAMGTVLASRGAKSTTEDAEDTEEEKGGLDPEAAKALEVGLGRIGRAFDLLSQGA